MLIFLALACFYCYKILIRFSKNLGFIDLPNQRKIHAIGTPRNGGLVLFFLFLISSFFVEDHFIQLLRWPATIVFLGGLIDDYKKNTHALFKLSFQTCACLILILNMDVPILYKILFFFLTLGMTNSFNLLDNMNGITAFNSVLYFILFYFYSKPTGGPNLWLNLILGSIIFLYFNYIKGQIFLGDQGSQFLGFLISAYFSLCLSQKIIQTDSLRLLGPVLLITVGFFFVYIYDTLSVICIRLKNKKKIYEGDLNHISHKIHQAGLSKKWIPICITALQIPFIVLAYFIYNSFFL